VLVLFCVVFVIVLTCVVLCNVILYSSKEEQLLLFNMSLNNKSINQGNQKAICLCKVVPSTKIKTMLVVAWILKYFGTMLQANWTLNLKIHRT